MEARHNHLGHRYFFPTSSLRKKWERVRSVQQPQGVVDRGVWIVVQINRDSGGKRKRLGRFMNGVFWVIQYIVLNITSPKINCSIIVKQTASHH
uniref:Uncharacterized protein n=1 Tax=Lactuca sativa TaxID=4236 RepID=A0A9R1W356_LACSA|nr:hypothetical protein LSAT_V11C300140740 [Lactuca sativa]